jgi:hypothetical protein
MIVLLLVGCATQSATVSQSDPAVEQKKRDAAEAETAAAEALAAMNGTPSSSRVSSSAPATAQQPTVASSPPVTSSGVQPAWVSDPYSVYDKKDYVAAIGYGNDRGSAEQRALISLTAVFGQSIAGELRSISNYYETVRSNGTVNTSQNDSIQEIFKTSTKMDSLIGAEVKNIWYDGTSLYYAVAAMERSMTSTLYSDMIQTNLTLIDNLLVMSETEKYSLDGYSRYQVGAILADTNKVYMDVLTIVGSNDAGFALENVKTGDYYRLEASNITKNIPIAIVVNGDRADRIKGAFASAINKQGFRSGGTNSRYVLKVDVFLSEVTLQPPNKYARIEVNARLTDTNDDSILFPYNFNNREGHVNLAEAENRAIRVAEEKINAEYTTEIQKCLATLLPR